MGEILELLSKETAEKLQKISKKLHIPEEEIVREGIEAYIQQLEKGKKFEAIGFGMWKDIEIADSVKWVEELRRKELNKIFLQCFPYPQRRPELQFKF
jgi:hypothetical protein